MNRQSKRSNSHSSSARTSTSISLLERVKDGDNLAWNRFVAIYSPFIYAKCRKSGFREHDAADITQNTFSKVYRSISTFRRDQPGQQFRRWLATLVRSSIVDYVRSLRNEEQAVGGSDAKDLIENHADMWAESTFAASDEDRDFIIRQAVSVLKEDFEPSTWRAFWEMAIEDRAAADVGEELGMKPGTVRQAALRVRRRLEEELQGLLDDYGVTF